MFPSYYRQLREASARIRPKFYSTNGLGPATRPTEADYKQAPEHLKCESPLAAKYFDDVKPQHEVYQYALNAEGLATHGFKTIQIVKSLTGVFVEACRDALYRLNARILKWQGVELEIRRKSITKWIEAGHRITIYAKQLFEV